MLKRFTSSFYLLIYLNLSLEISKVSGFILFTLSLTLNHEARLRNGIFHVTHPFQRKKSRTIELFPPPLLQESDPRVAWIPQTSPRPPTLQAHQAAHHTPGHHVSASLDRLPPRPPRRSRSPPLALTTEVSPAEFLLHSAPAAAVQVRGESRTSFSFSEEPRQRDGGFAASKKNYH